jgi:hypothetical protein
MRGTAYLSSSCSGRVLIAPAHSHSFNRSVAVAPGPVLDLTLSLAGEGQGLAAWVAGACSFDQAASAPFGEVASAAPVGRAAALAWYAGSTPLELSVWRP